MSRGGQRRADPVDDAREINRRVRRLERRRPDATPTVSSSSSGFEAIGTLATYAATDGDFITGLDFTWATTNCAVASGVLTVARTGTYAIHADLNQSWASNTDGYTILTTGMSARPCNGTIPNVVSRVSAAGISRGSSIVFDVSWYGITADDVTATLAIWGYPLELD